VQLLVGRKKAQRLLFRLVLQRAADVQEGETELEENQRVSVIVRAPDYPQQVAQQKQPEAPVALKLLLRTDHPRGNHRHHHRRPLNGVKYVHWG